MKLEDEVRSLHNYDCIPVEHRIKSFCFDLVQEDVEKLKSRIIQAREYLTKLDNADSHNLAIIKTKQSFVTSTTTGQNLPIIESIISKYNEFGIELKFDEVVTGASVLQYRFTPLRAGIKIDKASKYNADIQALLKTDSVLIETPIPKTGQIGIQIPRTDRQSIQLPETSHLPNLLINLGQEVNGDNYTLDIATAPHVLIAGSTGSGKSVLIDSIVNQLETKQAAYFLLDPKREFTSNPKSESNLEDIYGLLLRAKGSILDRQDIQDKTLFHPVIYILDEMELAMSSKEKLHYEITAPQFVEVMEELAGGKIKIKQVKNPKYAIQLSEQKAMPTYGQAITELVEFITRVGRSEKIHFIGATQNPTVKNLSSSIKANCPTRICLRVSQRSNSQVILDTDGGEKLLGKGDMLLMNPAEQSLIRLQGYYN
jgi:DNA segregation ATPase FtsK/SpoIIIE, S-DNA-T family